MTSQPKYSLPEIERRWLVSPTFLAALDGVPHRIVEDLYIEGTHLRLRKMVNTSGETAYKFCKKYGRSTSLANPITNIYLSEEEYRTLSALKGKRTCKRRYAIADGSIDVYEGISTLAIFEVEFESESDAMNYAPPDFAGDEVTDHASYSGAALASRTG